MKRRDFITLLGGAATAWPLAVHAQQPAMPVVGFLHSASPRAYGQRMAAFHRGLAEAGFADGRNLAVEYQWAEGHFDRLPAMAAELARRNASVIVAAGGVETAPAAKAATSTIPIVFALGADPIEMGLVTSLARPEGNITGVTFLSSALGPKRLGLLNELAPKVKTIAFLLNPKNSATGTQAEELAKAAATLGLQIKLVEASSDQDIATLGIPTDAEAILVSPDPFFTSRSAELTRRATQRPLPAIYPSREYAEAGGLMSYGTDVREQYRQVGVYTGRILKGEKPADLPIVQPTGFELLINLKTARAFGLEVPPSLLARADGVIE